MTGQPVQELQEMLQVLSFTDPALPQLIPDGRFGERTLEAVMIFQRDHGLPVTGTVDLETWNAIRGEWRAACRRTGAPASLSVLRDGKACLKEGEDQPPAPIVRAIFEALAGRLTNFKSAGTDGRFCPQMVEDTKELQRVCSLEQTGELDRAAWEGLSRLYRLFITRRAGERIAG